MSPDGKLRLCVEDDGDVIVQVIEGSDNNFDAGCVQFCTPFSGGGGSRRTFEALRRLAEAMAMDNADAFQRGRKSGEFAGEQLLPAAPATPEDTRAACQRLPCGHPIGCLRDGECGWCPQGRERRTRCLT